MSGGNSGTEREISRRGAIKAGGSALIAGLAGCQGDDGTDTTPTSTPESTPTDTQTPENGEDDGQESESEELLVPDSVTEDDWETVLEEVDDSVRVSSDDFIDTLTENDQYTENGERIADVVTDGELTDLREEIAYQVTELEEIQRTDVGLLETLVENPSVYDPDAVLTSQVEIRELFPEFGLERADEEYSGLTELEKQTVLLIEELEHDVPEELVQARNQILENNGYDQIEIDTFQVLGEYLEDTVNAPYPLIQQARDEGLFEDIIETQEATEELRTELRDITGNGVINRRDPDPDNYSATFDPYSTGFVQDLMDFDPETPTMVFLYESTSDADQDMVDHALEFMPEMYQGDGFQTILIEGRQNLQPFPDDIEGGDKIREIASPISDIFVDLPCHYLIFAEYDTREGGTRNYGLNGDVVRGRDPNYALVNVDPVVRASENWDEKDAVECTVMAETFDAIYDRDLRSRIDDWYRKWPEDGLSDDGKKSYSSWGYLDEGNIDRKGMLDVEKQMVEDSNLSLEPHDHRVEEVRDYQRDILGRNENLEFDVNKDYVKRISADELGIDV